MRITGVGAAGEAAIRGATLAGLAGAGALSGIVSSVVEQYTETARTGEPVSAQDFFSRAVLGGALGTVTAGAGGLLARRARRLTKEATERAAREAGDQVAEEGAERTRLLAELQARGVKHNPDAVVSIAKTKDDQIIFLEKGMGRAETNKPSGLQHILEEHGESFAQKGIAQDQVPDAVLQAVTAGKLVGATGRNRPIYEVAFNCETHHIAVTTGTNGYIVGANSVSVDEALGEHG